MYLFVIGAMLATFAIGMRDLIANVVGWMIIASHKGFQTGDRIEVGDIIGDVIDIGLIRTTIAEIGNWEEQGEQSTGRLVSVPNSVILTKNIINYNRGFDTMWNEIEIMITFESNWEKAEHILAEIANYDFEKRRDGFAEKMRIVKRDFMVTYNYISPKVYVTIVDSGVRLVVRHMVYIRERRIVSDELSRNILKAFHKDNDIEFAYNTIRYFNGPSSSSTSK
jgi:small-conductance mechanosensitive channel